MNAKEEILTAEVEVIRAHVAPVLWQKIAVEALKKLAPQAQWKNPVMFVVYVGSIVTTLLWLRALRGEADASAGFILAVTVWLWFTVLFSNAAEALAEGRSKAQAAALRAAKKRVFAKVLDEPRYDSTTYVVPSDELVAGKFVLVLAGEMIPADGEVIEGVHRSMNRRSRANPHR